MQVLILPEVNIESNSYAKNYHCVNDIPVIPTCAGCSTLFGSRSAKDKSFNFFWVGSFRAKADYEDNQ